jgi:hypothetical protein
VALAAQHGRFGVRWRKAVDEQHVVDGHGAEAENIDAVGHGGCYGAIVAVERLGVERGYVSI